jgi:transposase
MHFFRKRIIAVKKNDLPVESILVGDPNAKKDDATRLVRLQNLRRMGKNAKEIAKEMGLSVPTVYRYLQKEEAGTTRKEKPGRKAKYGFVSATLDFLIHHIENNPTTSKLELFKVAKKNGYEWSYFRFLRDWNTTCNKNPEFHASLLRTSLLQFLGLYYYLNTLDPLEVSEAIRDLKYFFSAQFMSASEKLGSSLANFYLDLSSKAMEVITASNHFPLERREQILEEGINHILKGLEQYNIQITANAITRFAADRHQEFLEGKKPAAIAEQVERALKLTFFLLAYPISCQETSGAMHGISSEAGTEPFFYLKIPKAVRV